MAKQVVKRNTLLLATGAAPTAADVITTDNVIAISPKAAVIEYNDMGNGKAGNAKTITNNDDVTAEFDVDVIARSSGGVGVAPKYASLLKCCGLKETIDTTNGIVTYTPELLEQPASATAYVDGYKRDITGIVGDMTISGTVGDKAMFKFSLKGFTTLDPIVEANPSVSLDTNTILMVTSASVVTAGLDTIDLQEFEFNLGNSIEKAYAIGTKEFFAGDFKPTIRVKAIKTKGNDTHWSDLKNSSPKEVVITLGTAAGDILELRIPNAKPNDVSEDASGEYVVYNETWLCENVNGGDNFTLTYK